MRGGEEPDAQPRRPINAFQHGAGRTFSIRPGDVDETKRFVGIACQRGEPEGVFQSELQAEPAQAIEELDGFGVGHAPR